MKNRVVILLLISLASGVATTAHAQDDYGFRFVRVIYDDVYGRMGSPGFNPAFQSFRGRGRMGMWATDYPAADLYLHEAISCTTNIPLMGDPLALSFNDPEIFEYPVLYLTEPGYWLTNPDEVAAMRDYFARGGFMIIDDFHDDDLLNKGRQWFNMYNNIKQVFPGREPVRLANDDPIWSIYYDIDAEAAPSTKPEFGAEDCEYYGIYDDNGRMMCFISYNQDIGDGWEWPGRLDLASTVSYQMAINIIMYAMTH